MNPTSKKRRTVVAAVSGGPDSVYLLWKLSSGRKGIRVIAGHVNYGTRGRDSQKDQAMVEQIGNTLGIETDIFSADSDNISGSRKGRNGLFSAGFENRARVARYRYLKGLSEKVGAETIALAHTADDQVETILMRVFEGAGIGGLKGIPRVTGDGITRPILDVWKEDILKYLKEKKIPYRIDKSNFDTRFERNWIRNVLIPLLVRQYGKSVKKRIFTMGERLRELDEYLEVEAQGWTRRNVKMSPGDSVESPTFPHPSIVYSLRRNRYSGLPAVLRVKILQRICFERFGIAPNERLLKAMDRTIRDGGPSARVNVGQGWKLANRYEEAMFIPGGEPPGEKGEVTVAVEADGKVTPARAKRLAAKGDAEVFDAATLRLPLTVRPLRAGDRIRPFGRDAVKRVKEILIDRKVPRDDRWGRPVVCDAEGAILWIPGVLRSAHAPVTPATRKTVLLRVRSGK